MWTSEHASGRMGSTGHYEAQEPLAPLMEPVARKLLGEPNNRLSRGSRLRFGAHGSTEVDVSEGWFDDYEANVRGGVLKLIRHKGGVGSDADAFRWMEDNGIKERSQFNGQARTTPPTFYDYRDEDGKVLFKVERRGKGMIPPFLQHGPDGHGGFHAKPGCMQDVRRVLYRLPELVSADPAEIVFVCEGEKDADRLAGLGLIATTNPGGALKFTADLVPALKGRRVVVLEDNDDAGKKHAEDVAAKLGGVAATVEVLRLDNLPPKGDVSDWLDAGGSAAELRQAAATVQSDESLPLPTLDLAALAGQRAVAKEFAIERLAPVGEVTLFTGPGSAGKSLLSQQLATAAAAELPCLGLDVQSGPAIYLTCEDSDKQLALAAGAYLRVARRAHGEPCWQVAPD